MKKCPYCAEEIQDEAIKCRFCGEWLEEKKDELSNDIGPNQTEDEKKDSTYEESISDTEYTEIKEKVRWGWGWFVLLSFYSAGMLQLKFQPINDVTKGIITLLQISGIAFLLFLYFWIRKKIIKKQKYGKIWHASFFAGIISYLVSVFLIAGSLGLVVRLDKTTYLKKFDNLTAELREEVVQLNEDEIKLWEIFIEEPPSEIEIKHNIQILNELISLIDKRTAIFDEYIKGYKVIIDPTEDKSFIEELFKLQTIVSKYHKTYQEGLQLYIEYYKTGDENKFNVSLKKIEEAEILSREIVTSIYGFDEKYKK